MLKNAPTLAIGGVDTEENEHCKVCPLSVYRSPRFSCEIVTVVRQLMAAAVYEDALGPEEVDD